MSEVELPGFVNVAEAFAVFASGSKSVQSQGHIRPLHQHLAIRLVIEGGFHPREITPRPPLRVEGRRALVWDLAASNQREQTVMGGLKTKDIDVVVTKDGVGPVIAISVKGTTGAFRNLTNRMEEAIGDSTNLHLMYPSLVYGFYQVVRANQPDTPGLQGPNDIAVSAHGEVSVALRRYHDTLLNLTGRRLIRDDPTRYEAVALALVSPGEARLGEVLASFPEPSSGLRVEGFFSVLLDTYDLRYPYMAPAIPALKRREWSGDSPIFEGFADDAARAASFGYVPRIG